MVAPPPDPARIRYAPHLAFPAYRYVPGSGQPHPSDPDAGHSAHAGPHVPHAAWDPQHWRDMTSFLWGVDLYNHAYFWEAHEAWEEPWQVTDKGQPPGLFLQALIQVAAAMLKVHLRSQRGAAALWSGAAERLETASRHHPDFMGLHVATLHGTLRAFFRPLDTGNLPDLSRGPPLILPRR